MIATFIPMLFALGIGVPKGSYDMTALKDGQVHQIEDGRFEAWDSHREQWVAPEEFWQAYAARRGGVTWGVRQDYPPYQKVKEFDTLIIELESGRCLMEFFHARWRRANDVRRWGQAFNEYGSCAEVFD